MTKNALKVASLENKEQKLLVNTVFEKGKNT